MLHTFSIFGLTAFIKAVGVVIAQYQLAFTFGLTRQFFRFFLSQEIAEASMGILAVIIGLGMFDDLRL
ncbi:putative membrane protein [Lyngbya aestuarii BL J]|uniref:Putative membrane protein n=1 Tax=Lyngbya aestuarii BL J TaxID=1348334 RepID=U7QDS8_9CYAN|nr:hypothetical protein [Lyngbya aestuarii]ERT06014.1 putative membrane protein [Lyngbya aestuarii BL J]